MEKCKKNNNYSVIADRKLVQDPCYQLKNYVNINNMHLIGYSCSSFSWGLEETPKIIKL